jgi:hypothetical protein
MARLEKGWMVVVVESTKKPKKVVSSLSLSFFSISRLCECVCARVCVCVCAALAGVTGGLLQRKQNKN